MRPRYLTLRALGMRVDRDIRATGESHGEHSISRIRLFYFKSLVRTPAFHQEIKKCSDTIKFFLERIRDGSINSVDLLNKRV